MHSANRTRALWLLISLVSIHMLVTTAIFLATGNLPNGLLIFTLAVFGVCALAALYFMATSRGPHEARQELPARERIVLEDPKPIVRLQVDDSQA